MLPKTYSYKRITFDKADKGCPLNLHHLSLPIAESHHEMEKVALAQIVGWLLLEVTLHNLRTTIIRNINIFNQQDKFPFWLFTDWVRRYWFNRFRIISESVKIISFGTVRTVICHIYLAGSMGIPEEDEDSQEAVTAPAARIDRRSTVAAVAFGRCRGLKLWQEGSSLRWDWRKDWPPSPAPTTDPPPWTPNICQLIQLEDDRRTQFW